MTVATKSDCIEVGEGPRGRGVFASQDIAAGQIVEICPTLEVEDTAASGTLRDYVFSSNDDENMAILPLGYGPLYNHSSEANCEYVEHGPQLIAFVARRDVPAGEELTIDYGDGWWDNRDEQPV
jgi:uncharacterized protein